MAMTIETLMEDDGASGALASVAKIKLSLWPEEIPEIDAEIEKILSEARKMGSGLYAQVHLETLAHQIELKVSKRRQQIEDVTSTSAPSAFSLMPTIPAPKPKTSAV